jgi:hypothetical protein
MLQTHQFVSDAGEGRVTGEGDKPTGSHTADTRIAADLMEFTVHPESRLVVLRFLADVSLTGKHGEALVDAFESVLVDGERFGLLADAKGVRGTDADYRAVTGGFFGQHRDTARIALINLGPLIRIVAEMFRVGVGLQMKTFGDAAAARSWLRTQGIRA